MRTIAGADLFPAAGDFSHCFAPADPLPAAATLWPDTADRVEEAVRVVNMLQIRSDLGTQPALGDRIVRIAVEVDSPAILDFSNDAAGVRAIMRTNAADLNAWHAEHRILN